MFVTYKEIKKGKLFCAIPRHHNFIKLSSFLEFNLFRTYNSGAEEDQRDARAHSWQN